MTANLPFSNFDQQSIEAAGFYSSIFQNFRAHSVALFAGEPLWDDVKTSSFSKWESQGFALMSEKASAVSAATASYFVYCETQEEVDKIWDELSVGGVQHRCGWLEDRFGVCWQIIPTIVEKLLADADPVKSQRVMDAMQSMRKLEIEALKIAHNGN